MNYPIVVKVSGTLLIFEALLMIPALLISIFTGGEDVFAFLASIVATGVLGLLLSLINVENRKIKIREGLTIVSLGWLLASLFGAIPFVLSGVASFVDAIFESVSGFSTTGATIFNDVEILPKGILFWRSFTHWIGGMGILVFTVAILPALGVGGFQIYKAESPGPVTDKIAPKIKDTAKTLYITYIALTVAEFILLAIGGMSPFEAAVHTFGTVGTGGFSTRNMSIGAYGSTYIHVVISLFMMISATNFSLYIALYRRKWREVVRDEEFRFFLSVVAVSTLLIGLNLCFSSYGKLGVFFRSLGLSLRDAFFQVTSVISTTGYSTVDFDGWHTFSKIILFFLMFMGGCAGSTGGGLKVIRILVLLKLVKREIAKIFHPRAVMPVKVGHKTLSDDTLSGITGFFALYILVLFIGTLLISREDIGIESAASSAVAMLSNIGPGFGFVGPIRTYAEFGNFSKMVMSVLMLLGRLELFTLIALLVPRRWSREV